jgi:agmatine deiminase
MISDREADIVYVSDLLEPRYPPLVDRLRAVLAEHGIPLRIIEGTKDLWCRDYMPVQVGLGRHVQFTYNPDYLAGYEHLICRPGDIQPIQEIKHRLHSEIVLDGGNVVGTSRRIIVTEKVFRENPGSQREHLLDRLRHLLDVEEVIVIPVERGDVIAHSDGMVRFLDDETVLVNDYSKVDAAFGQRLRSRLRKARLRMIDLLYCPSPELNEGIPSAVGCFANFLMVRGLVVVPSFGIPEDLAAMRVISEHAPDLTIRTIDCSDLAREGGLLNCATFTISTRLHESSTHKENSRE